MTLEELLTTHAEWEGLVQGLMVSQSGTASGLDSCSEQTDLPILLDDDVGSMWTTIGADYNSLLIVDSGGTLVLEIESLAFPDAVELIETTVNALLSGD